MKIFDYNDEHVGATEGMEEGGGRIFSFIYFPSYFLHRLLAWKASIAAGYSWFLPPNGLKLRF